MSAFGWSLPPGCGTLPGEEAEVPCQTCGKNLDDCICPECAVCGSVGDPDCYIREGKIHHGLVKTQEQIDSLAAAEKQWAEDNMMQAQAERQIDDEADAFWKENEAYDLSKEK